MKDLIGQRFGKLVVVAEADKIRRDRRWLCRCDCGKEKVIVGYSLKGGKTVSCGCRKSENKYDDVLTKEFLEQEIQLGKSYKQIAEENNISWGTVNSYGLRYGVNFLYATIYDVKYDLTGKVFGKLKVLRKIGYKKHKAIWLCQCECGTQIELPRDQLISRKTKSCGCLRGSKPAYNFNGYGHISGSYWQRIQKHAKNRGIKFNLNIQEVWELYKKQKNKCALSGLEIVLKRNLGLGGQTASLDRIDSKKSYTIDNVQWVHVDVNKIKNNLPEERLFFICEQIVNYRKSLPELLLTDR
jgi:hypothetical protein